MVTWRAFFFLFGSRIPQFWSDDARSGGVGPEWHDPACGPVRKCRPLDVRGTLRWSPLCGEQRSGKALFRIKEERPGWDMWCCGPFGETDWNSSSARLIKCIRLRISCVLFKEDKINLALSLRCSGLDANPDCVICFLEIA